MSLFHSNSPFLSNNWNKPEGNQALPNEFSLDSSGSSSSSAHYHNYASKFLQQHQQLDTEMNNNINNCVEEEEENNPAFYEESKEFEEVAAAQKRSKPSACSNCYSSKIRCNHARPCGNCIKSNKPSTCKERIPSNKKSKQAQKNNAIITTNNHQLENYISPNDVQAYDELINQSVREISSYAFETFKKLFSNPQNPLIQIAPNTAKLNEFLFWIKEILSPQHFHTLLTSVLGFQAPAFSDAIELNLSLFVPPQPYNNLPIDYRTNYSKSPLHPFQDNSAQLPSLLMGKPEAIKLFYSNHSCVDSSCICNETNPSHFDGSAHISADNYFEREMIVGCNSAFETLFGYSTAELVSRYTTIRCKALMQLLRPEFYQELISFNLDQQESVDAGKFVIALNKRKAQFGALLLRKFVKNHQGQMIATVYTFVPVNQPPKPLFLQFMNNQAMLK
jgi:hypothetical protein